MNIKIYDIKFGVRVARFREFNDHNKADLIRAFHTFIREKGLEHDFLVSSGIELLLEPKDEC